MGQVGSRPQDGIDRMLETGRGVLRSIESVRPTPASQEALQHMKDVHESLRKARAAVERIR